MTQVICALGENSQQWPDVGNGADPCCAGAAMFGPERCTCWTVEYDTDQADPDRDEQPGTRESMCHDCAYRPGSPERSGDPDASADADELHRLTRSGQTFWCHQGMRRPVAYMHPYGYRVDASALEYAPPMVRDGDRVVPFKSDGTPADMCAGWAAIAAHHDHP